MGLCTTARIDIDGTALQCDCEYHKITLVLLLHMFLLRIYRQQVYRRRYQIGLLRPKCGVHIRNLVHMCTMALLTMIY